jgi:hypothetical protein
MAGNDNLANKYAWDRARATPGWKRTDPAFRKGAKEAIKREVSAKAERGEALDPTQRRIAESLGFLATTE